MGITIKVVIGIEVVFLILCSACVIIAALFPPREYDGDAKMSKSGNWDESIEDM